MKEIIKASTHSVLYLELIVASGEVRIQVIIILCVGVLGAWGMLV